MSWKKINKLMFEELYNVYNLSRDGIDYFVVTKQGDKFIGCPVKDDIHGCGFAGNGTNSWMLLLEDADLVWIGGFC